MLADDGNGERRPLDDAFRNAPEDALVLVREVAVAISTAWSSARSLSAEPSIATANFVRVRREPSWALLRAGPDYDLADYSSPASSARTVNTGLSAVRTTFSVILPRRYRSSPVRPCVPITTRSIPLSAA